MKGGAGPVQGAHRGQAVILFKERGGTARGVVSQRIFGLQHGDARVGGKAGGGGQARDTATDDDDVAHASSILSVAGGGVMLSAVIRS